MISRARPAILALALLVVHRTSGASGSPAEQAGAALVAGKPADAAAIAAACPEPRCKLVLARALFLLGNPRDAVASV